MDPKALEKAFEIYPDVKLVVVAHLYGTPGKMEEIKAICDKHGALIVEDAAEFPQYRRRKFERVERLLAVFCGEQAQHAFFAALYGECAQADVRIFAQSLEYKASVVGEATFRDVGFREEFQAYDDGFGKPSGKFAVGLEHPVDTEAHRERATRRFQVDVCRALFKCFVDERVDQIYHGFRFPGIRLAFSASRGFEGGDVVACCFLRTLANHLPDFFFGALLGNDLASAFQPNAFQRQFVENVRHGHAERIALMRDGAVDKVFHTTETTKIASRETTKKPPLLRRP